MAIFQSAACRALSCPFCGTFRVRRRHRRGVRDHVTALLSGRHYRCAECRGSFRQRRLEEHESRPATGPRFSTNQDMPAANVTFRAPTVKQLDEILLALTQVVQYVNGFAGEDVQSKSWR